MAIDLDRVDLELLQNVADHVVIKKHMRGSGIGSIIWGIINCAVGFGNARENSLNLILGLIGLFLVFEGIYLLISLNPKGLIADGLAFMGVGLWNIFITIQNMENQGGGVPFWAILGVMQIGWGIQSFKRYNRFSHIGQMGIAPELEGEIKELINAVKKGNPKKLPDMIQFAAKKRVWKGRLSPSCAIMLTTVGDDIQILNRKQFTMERTGKALVGSTVKMKVTMKNLTLVGTISAEHMERFENWKNAEVEDGVLGESYLKKDFGPDIA